MSAKSILNKVIGVVVILVAVIFLILPLNLLNVLGLQYGETEQALLTLFIRILAVRNIVIGFGMLLNRSKLTEHYWLWAYVASNFADAILALFLKQEPTARYLVPLWVNAIATLFFVGVAYGLDIAGVFRKKEIPEGAGQTTPLETISEAPAEEVTSSETNDDILK